MSLSRIDLTMSFDRAGVYNSIPNEPINSSRSFGSTLGRCLEAVAEVAEPVGKVDGVPKYAPRNGVVKVFGFIKWSFTEI